MQVKCCLLLWDLEDDSVVCDLFRVLLQSVRYAHTYVYPQYKFIGDLSDHEHVRHREENAKAVEPALLEVSRPCSATVIFIIHNSHDCSCSAMVVGAKQSGVMHPFL